MRIAFLGLRTIGPSASGGIEKAVEELSTRYVQLGHDVTVFCRARYVRDLGESFKGVHVKALPAIYTKHLEAISNTVVAVLHSLDGYDVIHINAVGPALLSFLPRLFGKRVVVTVHGLDWKREKWGKAASFILRIGAMAAVLFPQRTVVVSKTLQAHYKQQYNRDVTYVPNGVNLPEARAEGALGDKLGLTQGGYILFLSRLVPEKGCHTLIEAFRRLNTDKKLVIVGPPSHSEDYARSLHDLAAGDSRIVFTGPLYGADKDAAYRNAYFFVLPSTIEGMALVLLEAMSYGKCCLCSDIEENREVIEENFGMTFATGNADDLKDKMQVLLQSATVVKELGQRARDHVAQEYGWDRIARAYLDVYRDALA